MKLYYSPGACSLSPHIVLREAGLTFDLIQVDLSTHKTKDGQDFYAINSKGYVPLLQLDNGEKLAEGVVIVQYLSDQVPGKQLMPATGSMERYHAMEWLNYIATELHKSFAPLFNASMPAEAKQFATDKLVKAFGWVDKELGSKQYLLGDTFSAADAYLFTVARWAYGLKVPIENCKTFKTYFERVQARPAVQEALKAEGLKH